MYCFLSCDQPTPLPLYETKDVEKLEVIKEEIVCVDEALEGTTIELENELITLEERDSKEVSLTKIQVEKYYDRDEHEKILPLVIYDDPPLKKLSEHLKSILKPLSSRLSIHPLETLSLSYHMRISTP